MITNFGKSGLALLLAGSGLTPSYIALGSGSGTFLVGTGSLYGEMFLNARTLFTSRDITVQKDVTWIWDRPSTTMSGIQLTEESCYQFQ